MSSSSPEPLPAGRDRVLSALPTLAELSDRLLAAIAARAEGVEDPEKEAEELLRCFTALQPDFAAYADYVDNLPATFALVACLRVDRATHYALTVRPPTHRHR